ncbi:MAG: redox-regulated ATPase YchF [Mycoplasmatales bacterium]
MSLTAGIVGLPNVGKSTLFNAITKSEIEAANYPFATIEPNVGIVEVPDERMIEITKLVQPQKVIPTTIEFTDIAGLVKGASKGEGLGNQFLANIREVDAIVQVVRCFEDDNIIHVEGNVNPLRDIETINLELIWSDLEQVEKRLGRIESKSRHDKDLAEEVVVLKKIQAVFLEEKPARVCELSKEEKFVIKHMNLLTIKPVLYVANVSEEDLLAPTENAHYNDVVEYANNNQAMVTYISAKIEEDLVELSDEEKKEFLNDLGVEEAGLDRLIKLTYQLLELQTYFTAGVKEVRAWTFIKGMTAPQCAGIIHTDFERGFIRAEIMAYDDLIKHGSEKAVKEAGKLGSEGKEYIMRDGDIVHFLFNV